MTRVVAAFLLAGGVAAAAPVPKVVPGMAAVFGELTDKDSDCTFDMQKGGALKVGVPAAEPTAKVPWQPQVAKAVKGDFVVTVRLTPVVPEDAKAGEGKEPFVSAGVSVCHGDGKGPRYCLQYTLTAETANGKTKWRDSVDGDLKFSSGGGTGRRDKGVNAGRSAVFLRLTRKGDEFVTDYRCGDAKWVRLTTERVPDLEDTLEVGPVAFGNIDQAFSVTFDQYEIKPLTKDEKK